LCCDIYGEEGKAYEPFSVFEEMRMEFSTPFHAGDPVYAPTSGVWKLTDISTWDLERIRQELPPTVYSEGFLFFQNKQLARCREFDCGDTMARGYTMGISSQDTIFPSAIIGNWSITSSPSAAPSAFCGRSATT